MRYVSQVLLRLTLLALGLFAASIGAASAFPVDFGPGFTTRQVQVNGGMVSVTVGGAL